MSRRRTISIHDYPEHLNPFSESHQPDSLLQYEPEFKFHTVGRPKRRSSISNAWNLFSSRKTKPVEASLNLSPRLPRSSSLADNELHDPPPPARKKLFPDLSWLPGRRRFGTVSQQSSPTISRRENTPYSEYGTMQRYRSISLTRTSENPTYRPGETPLITPRTHRYRSPSLSPSEYNVYRTVTGLPTVNGGESYYQNEQRHRSSSERLNTEDTPRRITVNGGVYNTRLYIDESPTSPTGTHGLERLYIEESGDRATPSTTVNRRLYIEEDQNTSGIQGERQYHDRPSSVSPSPSGGKQSPAVTPSTEWPSPFEEPLVSQRPPRPPRTKKRRAPLPPLPQFAQKPQGARSPTELRTTDSQEHSSAPEEKPNAPEEQTNDSEVQLIVTEHQKAATEEQSNTVELPMDISESQLNVVEQQTNTSEQQLQTAEQQTNISELQISAVEQQKNAIELQLNVTEQQPRTSVGDSVTSEETGAVEEVIHELTTAEVHRGHSESSEQDNETGNNTVADSCDRETVPKPETKVRTKFGVCDTP